MNYLMHYEVSVNGQLGEGCMKKLTLLANGIGNKRGKMVN